MFVFTGVRDEPLPASFCSGVILMQQPFTARGISDKTGSGILAALVFLKCFLMKRKPVPVLSGVLILALQLGLIKASHADDIKTMILPGDTFLSAGRPAFIIWPDKSLRQTPQPWVFYAPTLPGLPDEHEKWMHQQFLAAGVAVAGIDVGEGYGSPPSVGLFDHFYDEVTTERGLAAKPCLLGRSRGGLWITAWACQHPDRFSGLAGIYPVFDLRSYPGLKAAAGAYDVSPEQLEKRLDEFNPVQRMSVLAKAGLPAFIIHGDLDATVPLNDNSAVFRETYRTAGTDGAVTLIIAEGQGHNYWEGFFRCQPLIDFVIARAKTGR
jgi:pimeloyl-ACP methyl ester carboxylesterase